MLLISAAKRWPIKEGIEMKNKNFFIHKMVTIPTFFIS